MSIAEADIGHNSANASPLELIQSRIDNLLLEARNWLDGAGVNTEVDANGVSRLLDELRKASKEADALRVEEKRPFDEGARAVQAKYKPLLDRCATAVDVCKRALEPYLTRVEAEKRRIAEIAREEAEALERAAQEAFRLSGISDLEMREEAERLAAHAKSAQTFASRAEKDKAHAKGGERAVSLRTSWKPELTDMREAARHYWQERPEPFKDFLLSLAEADVRAGRRTIPGFAVTEVRTVV
jgi:hypothetical protein